MDRLPDSSRWRRSVWRVRARRCAICGRRLQRGGLLLREDAAVSQPQSWAVCAECNAAVSAEMERSGVQSPMRLRIAVGVVAARTERTEQPTRYSMFDDRFWEQLSDEGLNRLLIWIFAIAFGVHAVAFVLVAAYIAVVH